MEFGFLLFYFSLIRTTYQKPPSVFVSKVFIYWHVAHCLKFLISHISYLRFLIANKKMYHKKRAQEQLRGTWGVERTSAPISTGNSQKLTVVFEMHSLHHTHARRKLETKKSCGRRVEAGVGLAQLARSRSNWALNTASASATATEVSWSSCNCWRDCLRLHPRFERLFIFASLPPSRRLHHCRHRQSPS